MECPHCQGSKVKETTAFSNKFTYYCIDCFNKHNHDPVNSIEASARCHNWCFEANWELHHMTGGGWALTRTFPTEIDARVHMEWSIEMRPGSSYRVIYKEKHRVHEDRSV